MKSRMLLLVGALTLGGCLDSTAPKPSDPTTETFASTLGVNIASMQKTASGTYYQDLVVGTGTPMTTPTASTNVNVDYVGWLPNGTQFDSGTGIVFPLGNVIYGFADGMIGMNVGGTRLVVIPSENGYGSQPPAGSPIPANSTLVFRIKLNSFQ